MPAIKTMENVASALPGILVSASAVPFPNYCQRQTLQYLQIQGGYASAAPEFPGSAKPLTNSVLRKACFMPRLKEENSHFFVLAFLTHH